MTLIGKVEVECSVCGKSSSNLELFSSNTFGGSPDIDFRPPEMIRSTINSWICECPYCGYVASDLEKKLITSKEFLKSEEYLTCDGFNFKEKLSNLFYKDFLIKKQSNDAEECFISLRNCAWSCDDSMDTKNAKVIRKLALPYIDELIQKDKNGIKDKYLVIKADFLRRSGEFTKLIDEYENLKIDDSLLDKIIKFQIKKAKEKDTYCYNIDDVKC